MSSNDDGATKSDKIGDALVTALGFEPTDGESQRQAEISEQMSDTGFTVTDVLDRDDDDLEDFDEFDDEDLDDEDLDDDEFDVDELDDEGDESDDDDTDEAEALDEFDDEDLDDEDLDDEYLDEDEPVDEADSIDEDVDEDAFDELDDEDDESDDPAEAFVDSEDADASIGDVEDEDDSDSDDTDSSSSTAESEDPEAVIDSVVDATEDSASSNGASVAPASTGFFGSRRSGFGRSGSKDSKDKASKNKVYADTAFPDVESDPDITLIPDSPAITGEHEVIRVDADEPTVVQTREAVESRGVLDTVPSWGGITGWRPGGRRLQARKVRRVVRHIDPWSVLTLSVLFFLCLFAALLLASVLVWNVAEEAGTIENVENFILELGDYESFEIDGESIFRAAVAIMGVFTLAASVMVVLLTVMFNLLSDLLGGIRITVIEEETIRVRPRRQLEPASDTELLE